METTTTFELAYSVPVIVTVNTETGQVERVTVAEEEIKYEGANASREEIVARQAAGRTQWPHWTFSSSAPIGTPHQPQS